MSEMEWKSEKSNASKNPVERAVDTKRRRYSSRNDTGRNHLSKNLLSKVLPAIKYERNGGTVEVLR